ncbi:MAG TPA: TIGR04282 family arsenosugar biosynthesis glycosyltransferase [Candidatus Eisenbacteria bacterium]|nr:TIGR04282 family arsenosugar biosynthesis glycosyltransferase [Candidatus Eisenbacteria bacterium]
MSADAVALFAKTPRPGMVKTRLSPPLSPDEAAAVARVCLEESLRRFPAAVPASWTLFLDGALEPWLARLAADRGVAVAGQGDGDLGARLGRAFRTLHDGGARRAVAIGADSPTLDPARIATALERLERADAVLGPARDGGYYLIGIRPGREGIFSDIPWGTPDVADATRRRAAESGWTVAELPEWYDVDDAEGLRRAAADAAECPELLRVVAALDARLKA